MSQSNRQLGGRTNAPVRGPTSALTSFLQEQGISARGIAERFRQRQEEALAAAENNTTNPDPTIVNSPENPVEGEQLTNFNADQNDILVTNPSTVSSLVTNGSSSRKPRKRKSTPDDDDENASHVGSSSKGRPQRNLICLKCRKTIRATNTATSSFASLCETCSANNPGDIDALGPKNRAQRRIGRARETAAEFALVRDDQDLLLAHSTVPPLVDMCIKNLVDYLDDIEDVGQLSTLTMRKFARVICKKRQLRPDILPLFTGLHVTCLTLYDVTNLDAQTLGSLGYMCPNLKQLSLAFCGRANDQTIQSWINADSWVELTEITIKGPYLVRDTLWAEFFSKFGRQFTKIHLEYCAKLSILGLQALVTAQLGTNHPLEDLALHFADSLSSDTLDLLCQFRNLQGLSLMHSCAELTDMHINTITHAMKNLHAIALGTAPKLTDKALFALRRIQPTLAHLTLANIDNMTTPGVLAWLNGYWPPIRGQVVPEDTSTAPEQDVLPEPNLQMVDDRVIEEVLPELSLAEQSHWAEIDHLPTDLDFSDILESPTNAQIHPLVLETFMIDRCRGFNSDTAMIPLLTKIAADVRRLALNWADRLTTQSFLAFFDHAGLHPSLIDLNLSWVRCVDDPIFETLVNKMVDLERIVIFGCNKISEWAAHKVWTNTHNRPVSVLGSEFYEA